MKKSLVVFDEYANPYREGVKYLVIQTKTEPHYVWCTYDNKPPEMRNGLVTFDKETAYQKFDFQKVGRLTELYPSLPIA